MNEIQSKDEKCIGCLACVVACIDYHFEEDDENFMSGRIYEMKENDLGSDKYLTRSCKHCIDAKCMDACPKDVFYKNKDGLVLFDRNKCIGCKACLRACPFDIPRFDKNGIMFKCDGCPGFLEKGKNTPCEMSCSFGALYRK